jgi:hypothetical protein
MINQFGQGFLSAGIALWFFVNIILLILRKSVDMKLLLGLGFLLLDGVLAVLMALACFVL